MTLQIQQLMRRIETMRDDFHRALFVAGDLEAALGVLDADCELVNVPAGTGARGAAALGRFLATDLLPHLPPDLTFSRRTRTVDLRRVVEESTVAFTHDRELPWLLPGVAPTGRRAEVLAVSVASFRHTSRLGTVTSLLTEHRTLWDHHGLLTQLGLLPVAAGAAEPPES